MANIDTKSLKKVLLSFKKEAHLQDETGQVYYLYRISGAEFPVFLRPNEENKQLQIVLFIPAGIDQGSVSDLARILHFINKEIDLPGFGMDETANIIFYRQVISALDQTVPDDMIGRYLKGMEMITEMFAPIILNVATGKMTFDQVMKKLQAQTQQFKI